jgi:shikimate kinase
MSTGKTTIGKIVADRLGRRFVDGDDELTRRTGRTAREIAAEDGVDALHEREGAVVLDVLKEEDPAVLAASASTIEVPEVRDALRDRAFVVWLHADPAVLAAKVAEKHHRPDLGDDPAAALAVMAHERNPLFHEVADVDVDTGGADRSDVADAVLAALS